MTTTPIPHHIVFQCLQTLITLFVKHLSTLSTYPTFNKLWLQLIHLLSYFIARIKNEESSPYYTSDLPRILSATSPIPIAASSTNSNTNNRNSNNNNSLLFLLLLEPDN